MRSVFTLLTLPNTGPGFEVLESLDESSKLASAGNILVPAVADEPTGSSASPRKKPRLSNVPIVATRFHASTASRQPLRSAPARTRLAAGPITIQLVSEDDQASSRSDSTDEFWRLLQRTIIGSLERVGQELHLPASFDELYNACRHTVVVAGKGEDLYANQLRLGLQKCSVYIVNTLLAAEQAGVHWISLFVSLCTWFEKTMGILSSIMAYVDQKYAKPNNLPTVRQLGYDIFETSMFANSSIRRLLCQSVDEWTQYERKERKPYPDRKRVEAMFAHLTAHNHFQAYQSYFISQTKEHYMAEAKEVADKSTSLEYFDHVIKRINEEIQIAKEVLGTSSLPDVQRTVESALLEGRMEWLAQQNIPAYIGSNSYEQLASMYNLFYRVNGVQTLCSAFGEFVKTKVEEIINDAARDDDMVQRLLEFKVSADTAIARSFIDVAAPTVGGPSDGQQVNHDFVYALTDGFTKGFKARRNKPAEMIARYVDKCMRQGQRGVSDAEFAMQMDRALALYRFTDDKDVFRRFYHRALAKRLLTDRSASTDAEKRMLKNLKDNYDPEFDAGEEMFKDLALSHDLLEDYRDRSDRGALGQKLSVMVLQNSVWPFSVQKEATIDLPPAMQAELNAFELFYKSKHANRTLHWDHSLGTVTLKARFERGAKDLSVSLYQAAILLLFNDQDGIPFEEIKAAVRLADTELRRNLQSLACGKKHVLLKRPSGKQVDDKDIFVFNPEFWDERVKVHINSIQVKISAEESTKTHMAVEEERKHVIDAAIVRVMKAKKELAYEKLKNAVIEGVKKHFMPDVEAIKKRIDVMVDQEYIERSENDRNVFKYVA